jgi:hypothetical protein
MRRSTLLLAALLLSLMALMVAKSWLVQAPPLRAQSAAGEFDARRAKARLAFILGDQRPHPADTAASDAVRARLVEAIRRIGLNPVVPDEFACNALFKQRGVSCARVRNIIVMIGPANGRAVLLNAHYDTVPVGPGAADDGIGEATLLEVGSILKDQKLRRPLILLFNEGEELGLVGARGFLADPLSRNVGSLINLEARGVRGPVTMFETNRPNAAAIRVFAEAVTHPVANSLATDVYRLLPNYTDVNSFAERGWLTLNLAPIGNETRYHSPGDDLAALDLATLQHMGDQTLALTQKLANDPPQASEGESIFMDVTGRTLVSMPLGPGILLIAALLVAFAVLALRAGGLAQGIGLTLGSLAGSAALSWVLLTVIGLLREGMFWRAHPIWTQLTTTASTIFVAVTLLATIGRKANLRQLRVSFWLVYVIAGVMIGLFAPGGIIFFLFPPLLALAGLIASRWWKGGERFGSLLAIVILYLTWGALLGLLEELLNQGPMWAFAPLSAFLILPIMIEAKPLIEAAGLRAAGAMAALVTFVALAGAATAPAYSEDRQQRFVIEHVTDAGARESWWSILNDGASVPLDAPWRRGKLPISDRARWLAPAPANPAVRAPGIALVGRIASGGERTVSFRLIANGNERIELIAPEDAMIRSAGTHGFVRPIDPNEDGKYSINCFGRSCDGAILQLTIGQPKPVQILLVGSGAPLPPSAAPLIAARPKFARPQYNRDESIAFTRVNL